MKVILVGLLTVVFSFQLSFADQPSVTDLNAELAQAIADNVAKRRGHPMAGEVELIPNDVNSDIFTSEYIAPIYRGQIKVFVNYMSDTGELVSAYYEDIEN